MVVTPLIAPLMVAAEAVNACVTVAVELKRVSENIVGVEGKNVLTNPVKAVFMLVSSPVEMLAELSITRATSIPHDSTRDGFCAGWTFVTVTVFVAQALLLSLLSDTCVLGSTLQLPLLRGLDKLPVAVGVTGTVTVMVPPTGIVTVPLAVQVSVLLEIEQLVVPLVPPPLTRVTVPYVALLVGN